jgi:transcriptional regulator with GAF, ATPase, and Fis domain
MGGQSYEATIEIKGKSYDTYYEPIRDESNNITGVTSLAVDVTGHFNTHKALVASRSQADQFAIIYHLTVALNASLDVQELGELFLDALKVTFKVDRVSFSVLDETKKNLTIVATASRHLTAFNKGRVLPLKGSRGERAIRDGKPIFWNDIQSRGPKSSRTDQLLAEGTRSTVSVPLFYNGEGIGVLSLLSREVGVFTKGDMDLFALLAVHVSAAITNAQLFEKARESTAQVTTLMESANAAMFVYDETRTLYANRLAEEHTGYTKEELLSMPWAELHPTDA